jgi:voltage-gated potassium channel
MNVEKKFRLALLLLGATIVTGVAGYILIEGWPVFDSLYMTIITLATVGFAEVHPLSEAGRIFTMILIVVGVSDGAFVLSTIAQLVLEGQLKAILGKRKMEKQLQQLQNHIIVCGFGRVGRQVASEFHNRRVPFVIIEQGADNISETCREQYLFLEGNAADEDVLEGAGIKRARAIVSTLPNDADNVYLALTARQLNPKILIVARAESALAKKKVLRAGADKVICPHELGGGQMVLATLRPAVLDFMQLATVVPGGEDLAIEELPIRQGGHKTGQTIVEAAIKSEYDVIVIGLRKEKGELIFNPPGETKMEDGDILLVLGGSAKLERLAADIG